MSNISELDEVDRHILIALGENNEWVFPYKYLVRTTGYDRDVLKQHITRLKELGYVKYYRGLMDEEGQVAGSGFGVDYEKWKEIRDLVWHTPEHRRLVLIDAIEDYKHGYKTMQYVSIKINEYRLSLLGGYEKYDTNEVQEDKDE